MDKDPLLSVCLITYNHEKFVRQALDGIFMQQVEFPIEVIIADDFSTDNTRDIILEYQEKYKEIIRLIFQEKNVGPAANWLDLITSPKGKYVAYLDGDDYWTDPLKLQKQVDLLEKHPDISLVCGGNTVLLPDGTLVKKLMTEVEGETITFDVMDFQNKIQTHIQTLMFRNIPEMLYRFKNLKKHKDFSLFFLTLQYGKGIYVNELWSIYRMHNTGIWSLKSMLSNLKREYEESKELHQFDENKKLIRKKYFFDTLNYLNVKENNLKKGQKLTIVSQISLLARNVSEVKQLLHSLLLIISK